MRIGVLYSGLALLVAVRDAVAQPSCEGKQIDTDCTAQSFDNCTGWWGRYNQSYYDCVTITGTDPSCGWDSIACSGFAPTPGPAPGAYPAPSSLPPCMGPVMTDDCSVPWYNCDNGYAYDSSGGGYYQCTQTGHECVMAAPCDPQACAAEAPGGDCTNVKPVDPGHPQATCLQYYQPDSAGAYVQCMGVAAGRTPCKASTVSCPGPASSNSSMFMKPHKPSSVKTNSLGMGLV